MIDLLRMRVSKAWEEAGLRGIRKLPSEGNGPVLGRSEFAKVTKAYDTNTDTYVVVKRFKGRDGLSFADREVRRLRAAAGHPNVQGLSAFGVRPAKEKAYIVTPFAGSTYSVRLTDPYKVVSTALFGLAHLHRRHILHNNVLSCNLVYSPDMTSHIINLSRASQSRLLCALLSSLRKPYLNGYHSDLMDLCVVLVDRLNVEGMFPGHTFDERDALQQVSSQVISFARTDLVERWCKGHVPSDQAIVRALSQDRLRLDTAQFRRLTRALVRNATPSVALSKGI